MAHDPNTPRNFQVQVTGRDGDRVLARVTLTETIPAGGLELDVVWDPRTGEAVSVSPYRNLGQFVTEELARVAGGSAAH